MLTPEEKILSEEKTADINMDKAVPRFHTNQNTHHGKFLLTLNSLISTGESPLKREKNSARPDIAKRHYR